MNMQETFSTGAVGTSPSGYVVLRPQLPKVKTFMVAFATTSPSVAQAEVGIFAP